MTSSPPWADIDTPRVDYRRRIASSGTIVPVSWGKDAQGKNLLIIELDGDYADRFRQLDLNVQGMTVDLRLIDGVQTIVITLEQHVNADLFHSLCRSLITALENCTEASTALEITANHITRWRAFLSGRKSRTLSDSEIRGLIGELHLLRQVHDHLGDPVKAVEAWCGPDKIHQDFIFGDTAIETKSVSGRERNTVRISSEDQLEAQSANLYLTVLRLIVVDHNASHAFSLNELVRAISFELSVAEAIDEFWRKLSAVGYIELDDYDEPRFVVAEQQFYQVDDYFPRIVRSALPSGIVKVNYDIQLETIETFKCTKEEVWN